MLPRSMCEEVMLRVRTCDLEVLRQMQIESGAPTLQSLLLDLVEAHVAAFRLKEIEERERQRLAAEHAAIPPFTERPSKRGQWPGDAQSLRVHREIQKLEQERRTAGSRNLTRAQLKRRRRARIAELIGQGLSSSQVCERANISKNTYLRTRKRLTANGAR